LVRADQPFELDFERSPRMTVLTLLADPGTAALLAGLLALLRADPRLAAAAFNEGAAHQSAHPGLLARGDP
jgi:hypothetical protein